MWSEGDLANDKLSEMKPEDRESAEMNQNSSKNITVRLKENMSDASVKSLKVSRISLKKLLAD